MNPLTRSIRFIFLFVAAVFCLLVLPQTMEAVSIFPSKPFTQKVMITAYYSPLPGQCCYVRGGLEAEKILQGEGIKGADETPVYPGMAAAPPSYPFGTRIALPGIGTVEVNDRGGAIQVLDTDKGEVVRLDLWMGHGEEGLARALEFGVQRVEATVYPVESTQPEVQLALEDFPAPNDQLKPFLVQKLLQMNIAKEDTGLSVVLLQRYLQELGYYAGKADGLYSDAVQQSLEQFTAYHGLQEPSDRVTKNVAAYLMAAYNRSTITDLIDGYVDRGQTGSSVAQAQRVLRTLGYYKGRTTARYDDALRAAILKFQLEQGVLQVEHQPGAGRIGPGTKAALTKLWNRPHIAKQAKELLMLQEVDEYMVEEGYHLAAFLEQGYGGKQVKILQRLLADAGFFPEDKINGYFGELTHAAVADYQLHRGIIDSLEDEFAGVVGPQTMLTMRTEKKHAIYKLVKVHGWGVL